MHITPPTHLSTCHLHDPCLATSVHSKPSHELSELTVCSPIDGTSRGLLFSIEVSVFSPLLEGRFLHTDSKEGIDPARTNEYKGGNREGGTLLQFWQEYTAGSQGKSSIPPGAAVNI